MMMDDEADLDLLDRDVVVHFDDESLREIHAPISDQPDYEGDDDDDVGEGFPTDPWALNEGMEEYLVEDGEGFAANGDVDQPKDESYTPSIDAGDFLDPAQRFLFKRLKARIRSACNVNSKAAERSRALDWIFVQGTKDAQGIEFDPACRALGARPVIVRARTMHQLWLANVMLNEPLPFLAAIPPVSLISEIATVIGPGIPVEMAKEIWYWPSIPAEALRFKFSDVPTREYQSALASIEANGYVAISFARIYFISRNPMLLGIGGRNRFEFARSIYAES